MTDFGGSQLVHRRCTPHAYVVPMLAALAAAPAAADVARVGAACEAFMQGDVAEHEGFEIGPCTETGCSTLAETQLWVGVGPVEGWRLETGAPETGPMAGQRICHLVQYPDGESQGFEMESDAWTQAALSEGRFWQEDGFLFGCGFGDQRFTVASFLSGDAIVFSMALVPVVHGSCDGGAQG